jgi:hypothetical protein
MIVSLVFVAFMESKDIEESGDQKGVLAKIDDNGRYRKDCYHVA